MKLGDAIRRAREAKGWSLRELAKMTGLSHSFINQIELGDKQPGLSTAAKLAEALELDPAVFLAMRLLPATKRPKPQPASNQAP